MATLAVTNSFSAGTTIVAADMNENFDDVEAFINTTPGVLQLSGGSVIGATGFGVDGTGVDVTFYSDTAGDTMLWDASEEKLVLEGTNSATVLDVTDGNVSIGDGTLAVSGTVTVGSDGAGSDVTFYSGTSGDLMLWDASDKALEFTDSKITMGDNLIETPEFIDYAESVNAIGGTGGGTQSLNIALGNVQTATVDTSTNTFTFDNPSISGKSCSFTLILTNGASQTVVWPTSVDWAGGTAPTLTASGIDILTFMTIDGGTIWYGFLAGADMS